MLATFATLIVLVQHISTMLQAPNIAAAAGAELLEVVGAEPRAKSRAAMAVRAGLKLALPDARASRSTLVETEGYPVRAKSTGYIQYIDPEILLTLAREKNLVIHLLQSRGTSSDPARRLPWFGPRTGSTSE